MSAPVPYTVVKEWVDATRELSPETADSHVVGHLETLCTPETFGVWANTFSKLPPHEVEPFIHEGIRAGLLQATWKQSLDGIVAALGLPKSPVMPDEVWAAEVMSPTVMSAIADAVLRVSRPNQHLIGQWRRALILLARTDLASVIVERHKGLSDGVRSATIAEAVSVTPSESDPVPKPASSRPLLSVTPPPLPRVPAVVETPALRKPQQEMASDPSRPSLQPVAAVVVRSRECSDVGAYLAAAGKRDLTVETVFLASALTYRPNWRLLFEKPVSVKVDSRRMVLQSVTATMRHDSIALRFISDSGRVVPTHVNVDFR